MTLHEDSPQSVPDHKPIDHPLHLSDADETRPYLAPVVRCERVTSPEHFQDTRLVEFDTSGSSEETGYSPGDVCYVRPSNLADNVKTFFALFPGLSPDSLISLEKNSDLDLPPNSVLPPTFTIKQCVERLWDIQAIPGEL